MFRRWVSTDALGEAAADRLGNQPAELAVGDLRKPALFGSELALLPAKLALLRAKLALPSAKLTLLAGKLPGLARPGIGLERAKPCLFRAQGGLLLAKLALAAAEFALAFPELFLRLEEGACFAEQRGVADDVGVPVLADVEQRFLAIAICPRAADIVHRPAHRRAVAVGREEDVIELVGRLEGFRDSLRRIDNRQCQQCGESNESDVLTSEMLGHWYPFPTAAAQLRYYAIFAPGRVKRARLSAAAFSRPNADKIVRMRTVVSLHVADFEAMSFRPQ